MRSCWDLCTTLQSPTAGWNKKLRALRWIGPYYPGPGPEGRDMKTIEAANHETTKVIVLEEWGTNTKAGDKKTHITNKMVEQGWKCTVYDYVANEWGLVVARGECTEVPDWGDETHTRIILLTPGGPVEEPEVEKVDQPDDDAPADDPHGDGEGKDEEHFDEVNPPGEEHQDRDPPEAGHGTTYVPETPKTEVMESSAMLSTEVKTPGFETPEKTRQLSDDSVVGPFQLVNDVGDHPACAVDPSKEFLKRLRPDQEIVMSPTSEDDVRVTYEPGNEAQLPLEALYSCCDLSSRDNGKT